MSMTYSTDDHIRIAIEVLRLLARETEGKGCSVAIEALETAKRLVNGVSEIKASWVDLLKVEDIGL